MAILDKCPHTPPCNMASNNSVNASYLTNAATSVNNSDLVVKLNGNPIITYTKSLLTHPTDHNEVTLFKPILTGINVRDYIGQKVTFELTDKGKPPIQLVVTILPDKNWLGRLLFGKFAKLSNPVSRLFFGK